jgi:transcriptional regulator with XRE-family HTH domain
MSDKQQFAARLRELRQAAGLTQYELAARTGLHRHAIAKLERGERGPAWTTIQVLAQVLGVAHEDFLVAPQNTDKPPKGRPRQKDAPAEEKPATPRGRPRKPAAAAAAKKGRGKK